MLKVEVNHIDVIFHSLKGEIKALEDIHFQVDEGEFISIVGPSGCGKSTLLNVIAGLVKPSSGGVLIDAEPVDTGTQKIGYMFQKDHLFEWLTVWENVRIGLKIHHKLNKENDETLEQLLRNYKLWDFRNHYPRELSGGMRQRTALIRTLALNPEVLLLDEPFSALDFQTRLRVCDEIYEIIKKENKTAVMVTHDISEAISMSRRVVVLSKRPGKLKDDYSITFPENCTTPLKRREDSHFSGYFNKIWKELNKDDPEDE